MAETPDEKIDQGVALDIARRQADAQEAIARELSHIHRALQQVASAMSKTPAQ